MKKCSHRFVRADVENSDQARCVYCGGALKDLERTKDDEKAVNDFKIAVIEAFHIPQILKWLKYKLERLKWIPLPFTDKFGQKIFNDDIICDNDWLDSKGRIDYYRIYYNNSHNQYEAISCTNGYLHNITQESLKEFKRIGTFEEFKYLLECD